MARQQEMIWGHSRREVLAGGALVAGGAMLAGGLVTNLGTRLSGGPTFLIDGSMSDVAILEKVAGRLGYAVLRTHSDIGATAMHFDRLWSVSPSPLIGYATQSSSFIMQQIALRRGLRLMAVEPNQALDARAPAKARRVMSDANALRRRVGNSPVGASLWVAIPL